MLYQHIDPALVGNDIACLVSDMAGPAPPWSSLSRARLALSGDKEVIAGCLTWSGSLDAPGYSFGPADASVESACSATTPGERSALPRRFLRVIVEARETAASN